MDEKEAFARDIAAEAIDLFGYADDLPTQKFVIAFDVDGHLIDIENVSMDLYYQALKRLFEKHKDRKALAKAEKLLNPMNGGHEWFAKNCTGKGNDAFLETLNANIASPKRPINPEEFMELRLEVERKVVEFVSPATVFHDILPMLSELSQKENIVIYFVSGSLHERLFAELNKTGLIKFAKSEENIYSGDTFTTKATPLIQIMQKEGVDREHIIFSGDAASDMRAAKATGGRKGIYVIGNVPGEDKGGHKARFLSQNGADKVVHGGKELHGAILSRIRDVRVENLMKQIYCGYDRQNKDYMR